MAKYEFDRLKLLSRVIFDDGVEPPVSGYVIKFERDGGTMIRWGDGAVGTFYSDEVGSYIDWR